MANPATAGQASDAQHCYTTTPPILFNHPALSAPDVNSVSMVPAIETGIAVTTRSPAYDSMGINRR